MNARKIVGAAAGAVVTALLVIQPLPAVGESVSFAAVQDTYTDSASPTKNYGSKPYLRVDGSPDLNAFLQFDVQTSQLGSAVLRIYAESGSTAGLDVVAVMSNDWQESAMSAMSAPPLGGIVGRTGPITAGSWVQVDVSSHVLANGPVTFGLTTDHGTAIKLTSSEGRLTPVLIVPAPTADGPFVVTRTGDGYQAQNPASGVTYTGSLKTVVEQAVSDLRLLGGGRVEFTTGDFDLGSARFEFVGVRNIEFAGAGREVTTIRNFSNAAADTEPFDFRGAFDVVVRDLTVSAGGPVRSTSDALDFDQGNAVTVENVAVVGSRGRGIVFDGKNDDWTSNGNTISGCLVTGVPGDGIELLASTNNVVTDCLVTDVGGHGIQLAKSSISADQPNKKASGNTVVGNVVDQAGQDGINVNGGDLNEIRGNVVTNSADDTANRDGIRIGTSDEATCNGNVVRANRATDTQAVRTQRYGLNISSALCVGTVVGADNDLTGNRLGQLLDVGTATVYE